MTKRPAQKALIDAEKAAMAEGETACYLGPFDPVTVACLEQGVVTDRVRDVARRTLKDLFPATARQVDVA